MWPGAKATLVHAVKIDVGIGKTEINLQKVADTLRQMRLSGDKRVCVIAVPTHALGHQQMMRFLAMPNAKGLSAGVWRSREAMGSSLRHALMPGHRPGSGG
jgi:putative DNA primase/helicase